MTKNKKIAYIIAGTVVITAVLGSLVVLNATHTLRATGASKSASAPIFIFNETKALDWWAAENYNSRASTDENTYQGSEPIGKLPVASMSVFKGKKGEYATACFVMFSYYDYRADVVQLKKDKDSEVLTGTSMKKIGESVLSINALGTTKSFTLTNYELIGEDAESAMKGMSYGWVELGDKHISVSGVCPTGSELDETFSVIGAVSLVEQ